jgi:hypothetical protein
MAFSTVQIWNNDGMTALEEKKLAHHILSEIYVDAARVEKDNYSSSNGKSDMAAKLSNRFIHLPAPPWPQLDHRTPQAILNGHMVGFDSTESPTPTTFHQSNTIITAYYEFESKHGVRQYENWFNRILRTSEPMIIFVEPGSRWFDFVKEHRTHAPTIIAPLKFDDLIMSTTFLPSFWDFMHSIDLEAKVHKGSSVYKIWNEKLVSNIHVQPKLDATSLNYTS